MGENTDAKPSSSEANKTSTSSTSTSSQSGGRTRQPSSSGGSISTSNSMLLDGVVNSRKRRDTFNEHALHQTVAPSSPRDPEELSLIPTVLEAEASGSGQRSVPLHEKFPGKVVHDPEHADDPGPVKEVDRSIEAVEVTEESLVVNVSANTTNYSHDHITIAVDHLISSSSVSVGSGHSSASTSEFNRESPDDEVPSTTSSELLTEIFTVIDEDTVDVLEKSATPEEDIAMKAPIAKLVHDNFADFDRDVDNIGTSESSDIGENGDDIEATTSASDAEYAKLGADSSDYDRVVGGTTENDSNVTPVDYNSNTVDAADSTVEAVTEVHSIELMEDHGSNVSNSNTSEQLVSVEMNRNEVDASTISSSINIDDEMASFNVLLNNDEKTEESEEGIIKIKDNHSDKSKEKISSDENNKSAFTENISKTISMATKSIKSQTPDIVKETRELSRESLSSESEASFNVVNAAEQSEELQRDYPVPIYSYGQDEVEIVDLHHKKQSIAKTKEPTESSEILDKNAKMSVYSRKKHRDKDDLRIIMREESDNELLRKFEEKFHEVVVEANEPVENPSLIRTNYNLPPANILHETVHDSSDNASPRFPSNTDHLSNSPMTQRIQIVEVPVYRDAHSVPSSSSSSSSSPHRVLINVTIAADNPSAASSRPLYVLSVSVPTEDGYSSGLNIDQAQVPPAASMKKIPAKDAESINTVDTRLPPPPQPPASPPAPIWAGGECECSCPCMGSSSDEWDFSAIDDNLEQELESVNATLSDDEFLESIDERKQDAESAAKDSAETNATIPTIENYYPSSMDDIANNNESIDETSTSTYEPEVSTDLTWSCSGSTALPPEPTILILEGEATFTIISLSLFLFIFFFSLSYFFKSFLFIHIYFLSFVISLLVIYSWICQMRVYVDL